MIAPKKTAKRFFSALGFEINKKRKSAFQEFGGHQWSFTNVRSLRLQPDVLVDVGVANGTPDLYQEYPKSKLILIEPLEDFNESISKHVAGRDHIIINKAAGSTHKTAHLFINNEKLAQSSLYRRTMHDGSYRFVQTAPLDDLLSGTKSENIILKIDAEGAELEVLRGANETLKRTIGAYIEINMGLGFDEPRNSLPQVDDQMKKKWLYSFCDNGCRRERHELRKVGWQSGSFLY